MPSPPENSHGMSALGDSVSCAGSPVDGTVWSGGSGASLGDLALVLMAQRVLGIPRPCTLRELGIDLSSQRGEGLDMLLPTARPVDAAGPAQGVGDATGLGAGRQQIASAKKWAPSAAGVLHNH